MPSSLCRFLKKKLPNLRAIGFDFISISSLKNRKEGRKAHREFLKDDILIIEDMKLSDLKDRPDSILVSPLFIDKADGSPVSIWAFYNDFDINRYDYVFFDFDGVILDTVNIKTEAFKEIYKRCGRDIVKKVADHHLANGGMSRYAKFRFYHEKFLGIKLSDREVTDLADKFSKLVFKKVLNAKFIKGALEFLQICRKRKKLCFIVSSTPEAEINRIVKMRRLSSYFESAKGSPRIKEDNIKMLLKQRKIGNKKAVLFGDSSNDLEAARSNNIGFIGISCPNAAVNYKNFKEILKGIR